MSEENQAAEAGVEEQIVFCTDTTPDARYLFALQLMEKAPRIQQGDRQYTTVATRLGIFRRAFGPTAAIATTFEHVDSDVVRCRAEIHIPYGPNGMDRMLVATGTSEEWREASDINRVAALENAETSAIGRALASFGLSGGEFASVNEVEGAKAAQEGLKTEQATQFLTAEEIAEAVTKINDVKTFDELAEVYLPMKPALRVACKAAMESKKRSFGMMTESSAPQSGTDSAKVVSLDPPSRPQSGSGPRRGRSSGAA